jgi:PUA domain protein
MMPKFQVDRGAIPFVLRGANVLAPGLTSEGLRTIYIGKWTYKNINIEMILKFSGGALEPDVPEGAPVQITAEGKVNACAVGVTKMSAQQM